MYQPNDSLQAAAKARTPAPVTQTGSIQKADILDVAIGLRAMWNGNLPEAKPAAPVVVSEVLPQSGPREHVARRAAELKGSRFVSLARCEQQAWAELQFSASNSRVWAESRALKGMWDAVDSIEHSAQSVQNSTGDAVSPDDLGLSGVTEGTLLDHLADREEMAWKMQAIHAALSDREWTAIQMKAEGFPDAAIAEVLGASLPTTWKVIRQARAHAKAALA